MVTVPALNPLMLIDRAGCRELAGITKLVTEGAAIVGSLLVNEIVTSLDRVFARLTGNGSC